MEPRSLRPIRANCLPGTKPDLRCISVDILRPESSSVIEEVAEFMTRLNRDPQHHIAFCEDSPARVAADIAGFPLPPSEAMVLGRVEGALASVFAFDCDPDVGRAWLYGPFVEDGDWAGVADAMWARLEPLLPDYVANLELFFNVANRRCEDFGARHGFIRRKPDSSILQLDRHKAPHGASADDLTEVWHGHLVELHDRLFPNTHLPGAQLVRGLSDEKRTFVVTENGRLLAYIYCEVQAEVGHGGIDYLGVVEDRRGEGHGERLIRAACEWMFSDDRIDDVSLAVDAGNVAARNLYAKVGFEVLFNGRAMRRPRTQ
jgi:ribosomal protein S18 acetylase RimI-like enzyme